MCNVSINTSEIKTYQSVLIAIISESTEELFELKEKFPFDQFDELAFYVFADKQIILLVCKIIN